MNDNDVVLVVVAETAERSYTEMHRDCRRYQFHYSDDI